MILSFSLSNYRSIRDKAALSLIPAKSVKELPDNVFLVEDKFAVLRSSVIYGANASGKTNVINALVEFVQFIKNSSKNSLKDSVPIYDPFLLDKTSEKQPTEFEIIFLYNKIRYIYIVSCVKENIVYESLNYFPKGQNVLVFERKEKNPIKFGSVLKGEKRSIEARLLPNQLFLSKAANENLDFLVQIYTYFSNYNDNNLMVFSLFDKLSPSVFIGSLLQEKDELFFKNFQQIITSLDVGISALKIKKNQVNLPFFGMFPPEASDIFNHELIKENVSNSPYEIVAVHKMYDNKTNTIDIKEFALEKESSGTRILFIMAYYLLEAFEKGSVMIIDEFEKSLHPQIVRILIQMFNNAEINKNNAQLIFTTHNVSLLSNELFRRDQIWFTEKNDSSNTELYSLSQIDGVRKEIPYDKWYMSGRFGATPIVQEPLIQYGNAIPKGE